MIKKLIKKIINIQYYLYENIINNPYIKFNKIKYGEKYQLAYLYESFHYYTSLLSEIQFEKNKNISDSSFLITSIIFCSIYEIFEKISQNLNISNFFNNLDISKEIKKSLSPSSEEEINKEFIIDIGFSNKNNKKKNLNWSIYFAKELRNKLVHFNGDHYDIWHIRGDDLYNDNNFVFSSLLFEEKCLNAKKKLIISKNFYLLSLETLIDYIENNFYKLMNSEFFKINKNVSYIKIDENNKLEKVIKQEKLHLIDEGNIEELQNIFEFYNVEKTNKLLYDYVENFLNLFRWYFFKKIKNFDEMQKYKLKFNYKKENFFLKEPDDVFTGNSKVEKWIRDKIHSLNLNGDSLETKIAFYYSLLNFDDREIVRKLKNKVNEIYKNEI